MTANEITARLLVEIPKRFPGARAWRSNVLAARTRDNRVVRAGLPGQADITGIVAVRMLAQERPVGVRLEIEVKAGRDRLSEQQESFRRMIAERGGIHIVAHDVEVALEKLALCVRALEVTP